MAVTLNAVHPGVVSTGLLANFSSLPRGFRFLMRPFSVSDTRGAETAVYLASSRDVDGVTGRYFVKKQAARSSPASYDDGAAQRLWEVSRRMGPT